jgi:predicted LPLAT superfamily acyltransferase
MPLRMHIESMVEALGEDRTRAILTEILDYYIELMEALDRIERPYLVRLARAERSNLACDSADNLLAFSRTSDLRPSGGSERLMPS